MFTTPRLLMPAGLLLCAWLLAAPSSAATLYKYRDANGRWVFSDKPPTGAVTDLSETPQLVTQRNWRVALGFRGRSLWATSSLAGPVTISWQWRTPEGRLEQRRIELAAHGERPLELGERPSELSWGYAPGPEHETLPTGPGKLPLPFGAGRHYVTQGFHGTATHASDPAHTFAVDIALPEGTPVLAVMAGRVMELEQDFSRAGYSPEYAHEANFVRILHADGTTALYAHLRPGATVAIGQRVAAGAVVGYAGNTGYSSGPHLHFAVQANVAGELRSVRFEFDGVGEPRTGAWLGR